MESVDITIIGAGVIGLAIAARLAKPNRTVVILEQHKHIGEEISSRNSEVIHAGIYYPPQSLKARLCVQGKEQLYDFCQQYQIPHRRCGKLIVATSTSDEERLASLQQQAINNGVNDLQLLSSQQVKQLEPAIKATSALLSPSTGIIDSHQLLLTLTRLAEERGVFLLRNTQFKHGEISNNPFILDVQTSKEAYKFSSQVLINAGGLHAQTIANNLQGFPKHHIPPLFYCKGNYFKLASPLQLDHLVYPLPDTQTTGLGIHATIDLTGQVRFGPDTEYIDSISYDVSTHHLTTYYQAIQRYYPALKKEQLIPDYAGIRPKLQAPNSPPADFIIQTEAEHQIPGLINLFGIESPGLTAALAIADNIANSLSD
ncbi:NAD(P)/FAD-dependent oxidoreductase [Zooshikella harenae]|uniref:NAD(P)/FAD-dependent oxidoreductase n=1 Tax=Zooshikella harenae TaxID=2827238 RepID=A0ABS5ZGA2_9GAMM|nr:NAD(P)/FAD-dependent oxidoreductase [Zooshikella harenae]MBU2713079.1 NAD(P)/FAD-dependent oxidoreductase [Zooshikella harenae]